MATQMPQKANTSTPIRTPMACSGTAIQITVEITAQLRKITVTKVCEGAQTNRVTFYNHYLDVYDLYDRMVAALIESSAVEMSGEIARRDLRGAIRNVFYNIFQNAERYTVLFSESVDNVSRMKSMALSLEKLSSIDIGIPGVGKEQYDQLKKFLCTGGGGVLFDWLQSGMKQPLAVADLIYDVIRRLLSTYSVAV